MAADSEPTHPQESSVAGKAAVTLRVKPGQRRALSVSAGPQWLAVDRYGGLILRVCAWSGLAVAAAVLLIGLVHYPVQVTPDEVYPSLRAAELIGNGFSGEDGALLPAFLPGSTPFGVGAGAYLQALPQLLRPNTLAWIRGFNAVLALLAVLVLAAWLRISLRLRQAWLLLPLLASVPAWFTFSRSGLDITLAASLLTAAFASYGLYRAGRLNWIFAAVVLAWLGFYSHPAARLAVPLAAAGLLASDWRYHWAQRRRLLPALVLAAAMAVPLVVFLVRHPAGIPQELAAAGSFLTGPGSAWQKAGQFLLAFLNTFNPFSWLLVDLNLPATCRSGLYPPLPWLLAPFIAAGGRMLAKRLHQAEHRALLVGLAAAAAGAAPFGGVLPASLLAVPLLTALGLVGLHAALDWLKKRVGRLPDWLPAPLLLLAAGGGALFLLGGALGQGPRWQSDYGREGLQFGAPQIFAAAGRYLASHPGRTVLVWPEWSNDPQALRRFFISDAGEQVQMGYVDGYLYRRTEDIGQKVFVLPAEQFDQLAASGKFEVNTVETIPYPDDSPGFYLAELNYTPRFEALVAAETEQRRVLVRGEALVDGETVTVWHSQLDIGAPSHLFDSFADSLVRSAAANPLVIELHFPQPKALAGVTLDLGAEPITVTAELTLEGGQTQTFTQTTAASNGMKQARIAFGGMLPVATLRLEVLDESAGDPGHVHLWEVRLNR